MILPDHPRLRRVLAFAALLMLIAGLVAFSDWRTGRVRGDFSSFSLAASRVLYEGGEPYSKAEVGKNFKYLPFNALVLRPFINLPIPVAQGLWFAFNSGLLLICLILHRRMLAAWSIPAWIWGVALALAGRYLWQNLKMGQWNMSVYCFSFIGLYLVRRRPWLGGALVGLAATLKYMPVFFVMLFVVRRQWRAALGLIGGIVLCALVIPSLVFGPARHFELLKDFRSKVQKAHGDMTVQYEISSHSPRSMLYLLLTDAAKEGEEGEIEPQPINVMNLPKEAANRIALGCSALFLAGVIALSAWLHRRHPRPAGPVLMVLYGLWFLTLLAISPEVRKAHLLTLFTPALGLLAWAWSLGTGRLSRDRRLKWVAGLSVGLAALFTFLSSEIIEPLEYNDIIAYFGGFTAVIVTLTVGTIYCLIRQARTQPPAVHS